MNQSNDANTPPDDAPGYPNHAPPNDWSDANPYGSPEYAAPSSHYPPNPPGGYPPGAYGAYPGYPPYYTDPAQIPHSGVGITSLILGVLVILLEFGSIVTAGVIFGDQPPVMGDQPPPEAMIIGLGMCSGVLLAIIGAVLGGVALAQANRKKMFGVIGLAINGLVLLGMCGMMALGMAMQGVI